MTTPSSPYPSGPPVAAPRSGPKRPWWGAIDIVVAVPFVFGVSFVGVAIASAIALARGDWSADDGADLPVYGLFLAVAFQQTAQGAWPWIG